MRRYVKLNLVLTIPIKCNRTSSFWEVVRTGFVTDGHTVDEEVIPICRHYMYFVIDNIKKCSKLEFNGRKYRMQHDVLGIRIND